MSLLNEHFVWKRSQMMPQMSIFMQIESEAEGLGETYEFHINL